MEAFGLPSGDLEGIIGAYPFREIEEEAKADSDVFSGCPAWLEQSISASIGSALDSMG
jgi:hypothetical protein